MSAVDHALAGRWEAAHQIVQAFDDDANAFWIHGVLHVIEGDRSNAAYWFERAGRELSASTTPEVELRAIRAHLEGRGA